MKSKTIFILFFTILLTAGGYAQRSKEALQREINALQTEIENANRLLKQVSQNRQATLSQVSLMDKRIKDRQKLISAYEEQVRNLDRSIRQGESNITRLNGELKRLRGEYSKMIQFAYKNKNRYDQLEFLFAAEDFNQATRRMRYIQQFADARMTKMNQIAATQQRVTDEVESNRRAREEQAALLADAQAQKQALEQERAELNTQVKQLKKQEGGLQQSIKEKQAQAKKFQKQIDEIIAEEIRRANESAAAAARTKSNKSNMALTPSEMALSTSFTSNKGKLPWPVERGVVSSSFGKHASAFSDNVTVTNNGIDIATTEGARARSVFDGVVVSVVKPSASNIGVIIRHGDYFTVYSQLDEVYVNRGDKVKTKQEIGRVHTDRAEGRTEIHFELRQGTACQNPSSWLAR